jgi:DNA repair protein RadC
MEGNREESLPDILERLGESALTDSQLVALLFPRGSSPGADAAEPGGSLFRRYPSLADLDRASLGELRRQRGVGRAKAARIKAVFEIGRRLVAGDGRKGARFTSSREVADYFRPLLLNRRREVFVAALLNGRHELIREVTVSVGCLTSSIVHPREVFAPAVRESAAAVLFVHNHPSGDPTPSDEDRRLTERLVEAGGILGIKVLDHVVVARGGFVSLLETHP